MGGRGATPHGYAGGMQHGRENDRHMQGVGAHAHSRVNGGGEHHMHMQEEGSTRCTCRVKEGNNIACTCSGKRTPPRRTAAKDTLHVS